MPYKQHEFDALINGPIVAEAKNIWIQRCKDAYARYGDEGSCVLGAGITVEVIPPRCRNPRTTMLISSHDVGQCQGSLNWERSQKEIVEFLRSKGVDCRFEYGRLD